MKNKFWIVIASLLLVYLAYDHFSTPDGVSQISAGELEELIASDGDHYFLDVRETHEFAESHVAGMTNIPLSVLTDQLDQLPDDRELVIFCRSGNRSMQAAEILQSEGFEQLTNVRGGMNAWNGETVTP
ncbi:rhodanese-like domain-containing protein [Alteribacter natronophilus]|uniref:rhodanese-like domain-containing protein n=1 Tax=Alteribacter natronophilus TaxID=2583810 RepID=UPI00110D408D|nr:rhodanese-like domain-containing protein [Alteribacter natronophilus]TMW71399.1 rhodanese-like domain-containing protein [Alteribacter natronophilus]